MSKYKTCPECGAHLDAGEICECKKAAPEAGNEAGERATANPHEPALAPGA